MTNEQTIILLLNMVQGLKAALEKADSSILSEPRNKEERYIGPQGLGAINVFQTARKPEDYEEIETDVIALEPIKKYIETMERQIKVLGGR